MRLSALGSCVMPLCICLISLVFAQGQAAKTVPPKMHPPSAPTGAPAPKPATPPPAAPAASTSAPASGTAAKPNTVDAGKIKILEASGAVTVNNAAVKVNDAVGTTADFKVGPNGRLRAQLADGRTMMVLGSDTDVGLKPKGKSVEAEVRSGISRWIVAKAKDGSTEQPSVRTRTAVMGVRGTDFFVVANTAFNETEVVCTEGVVELANAQVSSDKKLIQKNQWGGLGGRFGQRLAQTLTLSAAQIELFNRRVPKTK